VVLRSKGCNGSKIRARDGKAEAFKARGDSGQNPGTSFRTTGTWRPPGTKKAELAGVEKKEKTTKEEGDCGLHEKKEEKPFSEF